MYDVKSTNGEQDVKKSTKIRINPLLDRLRHPNYDIIFTPNPTRWHKNN